MSVPELIVTLYDRSEARAFAKLEHPQFCIEGIQVYKAENGGIQIHLPKGMSTKWKYEESVSWKKVQMLIREAFMPSKARPKRKAASYKRVSIRFHTFTHDSTCIADCFFKDVNVMLEGIHMDFSSVPYRAQLPYGVQESDLSYVNWSSFSEHLGVRLKSFLKQMNISEETIQNEKNDLTSEFFTLKAEKLMPEQEFVETSYDTQWEKVLGRHDANSIYSPLIYKRNTILRLENFIKQKEMEQSKEIMKLDVDGGANLPIDSLVSVLSQNDFIGPFELDVLSWINRLRYVTTSMILDLYVSHYIAPTWRKMTKDKFSTIIKRMRKYNLLNVLRFASIDDAGKEIADMSMTRIYTLGKTGHILLRQLNRESEFNPFDIYQDGNVVKAYLAANQHLVRWLTSYPALIHNHYETAKVLHSYTKGKNGARFYGVVNCGELSVVLEPVRRSAYSGSEEERMELQDKCMRMLTLIADSGELYRSSHYRSFYVKASINPKSIICYTCEDEKHMREVWEIIKPIVQGVPAQQIWFTHDLQVYNESARGNRYFRFLENDSCESIDIKAILGVEERVYDSL